MRNYKSESLVIIFGFFFTAVAIVGLGFSLQNYSILPQLDEASGGFGDVVEQINGNYNGTAIVGYKIPELQGAVGTEQHCVTSDAQYNMDYCDAIEAHYRETGISGSQNSHLQNGMAFTSGCQIYGERADGTFGYAWAGDKPSCYNGYFKRAKITKPGCSPLPAGKCAPGIGYPENPLDEKYFIAMWWENPTPGDWRGYRWLKTQRVLVKNNVSGKCAIAVPLEKGPGRYTGKAAGLSPELADVTQMYKGYRDYSFRFITNSNHTLGPVNCPGDVVAHTPATLELTLRGTKAYGQGPRVKIFVNGEYFDKIDNVSNSNYQTFRFDVSLGGTTLNREDIQTVALYFDNDASSSVEDRNLFVQKISVSSDEYFPNSAGVSYDRFIPFDNVDVIGGQEGMYWKGVLIFNV